MQRIHTDDMAVRSENIKVHIIMLRQLKHNNALVDGAKIIQREILLKKYLSFVWYAVL